jgi:Zn-dependent protease
VNGRYSELGKELVLTLVTMLLSLSVHEYAHAVVANALGDDTPRRQGRLTLSPLAHYDIWGTFLIPIVAILSGGGIPFIGWARPVETNPGQYTRKLSMRTGHRLVAAAGPLSNLLLATLSMGLLTLLAHSLSVVRRGEVSGTVTALATLLGTLVRVNIGLCVLNFLPLPPLDGSRLLPRSLDDFQRAIAPYSFFIMIIILNVAQLRVLFLWPVRILGGALQALFGLDVGLA